MMPPTIFINVLKTEDKRHTLLQAIDALRDGNVCDSNHSVEMTSLAQIPGTPFGYWVSDDIRAVFTRFHPFELDQRKVRAGLQTSDDFRFVRAWWEVPPGFLLEGTPQTSQQDYIDLTHTNQRWVTLSKGGGASPFFNELYLVVDWHNDGKEMKAWNDRLHGNSGWSRNIRSTDCYFLPGISWAVRTRRFSPYVVPAGGIFSVSRYQAFAPAQDLLWILALMNSSFTTLLLRLCSERYEHPKFVVGIVSQLPFPLPDEITKARLKELAIRGIEAAVIRSRSNENSRHFLLPAVLRVSGESLLQRIAQWQVRLSEAERDLRSVLIDCDTIGRSLYDVYVPVEPSFADSDGGGSPDTIEMDEQETEDNEADDGNNATSDYKLIGDYVSYLCGCVVGRWDLHNATTIEIEEHSIADAWQILPRHSPGMNEDVSSVKVAAKRSCFPSQLDGIVCDDPDHVQDVIRQIRVASEDIWKDGTDAIETEVCQLLDVKTLRDYFRKPGKGGFWDDHISRYSKSRRKAPIYWLLQSSKKNYAIWLYYHRLDKDLLFKALVNYVEPKIRLETSRLETLRSQSAAAGDSGKEAKRLAKEAEKQEDFLSELRDFEDKLRRAANLHLEPDLNDGVVLNIAPLHELVPWKEAKKYWDELIAGKYEWSSIGKQLRQKGLVR